MFELRNATVRYNEHAALRNISLRIGVGERVALVGRSGAGKSTLLKLLYEQRRDRAALVPQPFGLVNALSVFHNVFIGRLNRHAAWYNILNLIRPTRREIEEARSVISELGLEDKLFTPVGELSGGQQQRTAVGRALHQEAEVLLGDEPVSNVDEHQARTVLDSISDRHDTVVLAMHDVELALDYTDRVVGLRDGVVVMDEPTAELKPSELYPLYKA